MDLSLIPIGAYAPRWFMMYIHVNLEKAAKINPNVKSHKSIGMHWGYLLELNGGTASGTSKAIIART